MLAQGRVRTPGRSNRAGIMMLATPLRRRGHRDQLFARPPSPRATSEPAGPGHWHPLLRLAGSASSAATSSRRGASPSESTRAMWRPSRSGPRPCPTRSRAPTRTSESAIMISDRPRQLDSYRQSRFLLRSSALAAPLTALPHAPSLSSRGDPGRAAELRRAHCQGPAAGPSPRRRCSACGARPGRRAS
jgi:hypothetical protein